MASETRQKNYGILISFDVKADEKMGIGEGKFSFLMKYWLEPISFGMECKERYKFLSGDSTLRKQYEDLLSRHKLVYGNVRFQDHFCYVLLM